MTRKICWELLLTLEPRGARVLVSKHCKDDEAMVRLFNVSAWCALQHAAYGVQHATYGVQHATYGVQHRAYGVQHATYGVQHAAYKRLT